MYYLLSISDNYPENLWFKYDRKVSPNHLKFKMGQVYSSETIKPVFRLNKKINNKKFAQFDWFWSDGPNFVSPRLVDYFQNQMSDDIQLIDADVWINDVLFQDYKIPNILHSIRCIDLAKSDFEFLINDESDGPKNFNKYILTNDSLGMHKICRASEQLTTIVVQESFAIDCKELKVNGLDFLTV